MEVWKSIATGPPGSPEPYFKKKNQSASLYILCKDFNPFKFTVISDKERIIFAILLCVFYISYGFFVLLFLYYCFDLCLIDFF